MDSIMMSKNLLSRIDEKNKIVFLKRDEESDTHQNILRNLLENSNYFKLCLWSGTEVVFLNLHAVISLSPFVARLVDELKHCCLSPHDKVHICLDQFPPRLLNLVKNLLEKGECTVQSNDEEKQLEALIHALGMDSSLQLYRRVHTEKPRGRKRKSSGGENLREFKMRHCFDCSQPFSAGQSHICVISLEGDVEYGSRWVGGQGPSSSFLDGPGPSSSKSSPMRGLVPSTSSSLAIPLPSTNGLPDHTFPEPGLPARSLSKKRQTFEENNNTSCTSNKNFNLSLSVDTADNHLDFKKVLNRRIQKSVNKGEKQYACKECDYKCSFKSTLMVHIRKHTGEKPYSCLECNFKCSRKTTLTRHMITHSGEKPYACEECDYKSIDKYNLMKHIKIHTGEKPFSCPECDYKSLHKATLMRHMRTHSGEKRYACEECDYKCIEASKLKIHMRTHSREKPFACEECDYKSTNATNLKRHIRIHTGEMPYQCEICEKKFAQLDQLKFHRKRLNKCKKQCSKS